MSMMEVLVVLAVGLIAFGPDRLPHLAKNLAKLLNLSKKAKGKAQDFMAKQQALLQLEDNLNKAALAEKKHQDLNIITNKATNAMSPNAKSPMV